MKPVGIMCAILFASLLCGCSFARGLTTALRIASGDIDGIQKKIDLLESRAIAGAAFSESEKAFLIDLYDALALGGRALGYSEASAMLRHYLHGNGEPLRVGSKAYSANPEVRAAMEALLSRVRDDRPRHGDRTIYSSPPLHIAPEEDPRLFYFSNIFTLEAMPEDGDADSFVVLFRVELTCRFPSYRDQERMFRDARHFHTPFPTPRRGKVLTIDDGLSQYLTVIGAAKEFQYTAEWSVDGNGGPGG
jgi:hypothetical protein